MHSARFLLAAAPLLSLALAQDDSTATDDSWNTDDSWMTMTDSGDDGYAATATYDDSIPASSYLSAIYGTAIPPAATGAAATSLAKAFYSYEIGLQTDTAYQSAANEIYYAAASASNSDEIFSSLETAGVMDTSFTTAAWYADGVDDSAKSEFASIFSAYSSVQTSVLGAAAATTTGASTGSAATTAGTATKTGTSASGSATSTSASTAGAPAARITGAAAAGLAAAAAFALL
ncbi:hypothetical protein G7054_g7963 [Neopestalotiopsis clavispora]|nr:hypothetical protein G7054_g7963 [Neopestalotiopsis clavispora]